MAADHEDFAAHPEWFTLEPFKPSTPENFSDLPTAVRDQIVAWLTNPPVVLRRKPVPFVLRIRGAG